MTIVSSGSSHTVSGGAMENGDIILGDFTGTGTDDILFRNNTNGDTGSYEIVGGINTGWHDVDASSTAYHITS